MELTKYRFLSVIAANQEILRLKEALEVIMWMVTTTARVKIVLMVVKIQATVE